MKKAIISVIMLLCTLSASYSEIRIAAAYPYIADVAAKIGGDRVKADALAPGNWDPHFVPAKPSLIAKLRNADLLIANGAELEIGWLPPVVRESRNAKIMQGAKGFLDLSDHIKLIDIPVNISRAKGDVHPSGNPHFCLDPANILLISKAVSDKLCEIDPAGAEYYKANQIKFSGIWNSKMIEWDKAMAPLKGSRVVQYHKIYDYFFKRYGMQSAGELEPLPGISPSSGHIARIIETIKAEKIRYIFNDVYHSTNPAELVAGKTGARVLVIPHDVGAVKEARDVVSLFDEIVRRITK
ncbi:MAG: zinc ABC transporter substrate-binding protein [Spirochaetota bacterium]